MNYHSYIQDEYCFYTLTIFNTLVTCLLYTSDAADE